MTESPHVWEGVDPCTHCGRDRSDNEVHVEIEQLDVEVLAQAIAACNTTYTPPTYHEAFVVARTIAIEYGRMLAEAASRD